MGIPFNFIFYPLSNFSAILQETTLSKYLISWLVIAATSHHFVNSTDVENF